MGTQLLTGKIMKKVIVFQEKRFMESLPDEERKELNDVRKKLKRMGKKK